MGMLLVGEEEEDVAMDEEATYDIVPTSHVGPTKMDVMEV